MSEWHNAEDDNIEIDLISKEVNILVTTNNWGAVYMTLSFQQIRKLSSLISANAPELNDG